MTGVQTCALPISHQDTPMAVLIKIKGLHRFLSKKGQQDLVRLGLSYIYGAAPLNGLNKKCARHCLAHHVFCSTLLSYLSLPFHMGKFVIMRYDAQLIYLRYSNAFNVREFNMPVFNVRINVFKSSGCASRPVLCNVQELGNRMAYAAREVANAVREGRADIG